MAAGDSSPFRRMPESLSERRCVLKRPKAVSDAVGRQIDVHVPFKWAPLEPIEDIHSGIVEGQRHLVRKVSIDFQGQVHEGIENK